MPEKSSAPLLGYTPILTSSHEVHTIILVKSLYELNTVYMLPQSFSYRSLAFWNNSLDQCLLSEKPNKFGRSTACCCDDLRIPKTVFLRRSSVYILCPGKRKERAFCRPPLSPLWGAGVYCPRSAQGWWVGVEARAAPLFVKIGFFIGFLSFF